MHMDRIATARARIEQAGDLAGVLDAAYDAFEDMLAVIRHHQERDMGAFAAFVLAAAAAGNGRDWIAAAPSLPPAAASVEAGRTDDLLAQLSVEQVAVALAGISQALATRLTASAAGPAGAGDRDSCAQAARHATRIRSLLAGARQP